MLLDLRSLVTPPAVFSYAPTGNGASGFGGTAVVARVTGAQSEIKMLAVTIPYSIAGVGYAPSSFGVNLSGPQAEALRGVITGLLAQGVKISDPNDVVRWMLDQVAIAAR
jgi:hypothetical protein